MPRRKAAEKREKLPDPLYGSTDLARFINVIMRDGKKATAEGIVYNSLTMLEGRVKKEGKSSESASHVKAGKKPVVASKGKDEVSTQGHGTPMELFVKALKNVAPKVEVKSRRVGGATYQVPIEVADDRGLALAMRWVVKAARGRSEKTMAERLAAELYDAYLGRGAAVKICEDVYRMAEANKAFAHYRW